MFVCLYQIHYTKIYCISTTYVNEMILILFTSFDINIIYCKQITGNVFLGHLGEQDFHISLGCTLNHGRYPSIPFRIFTDHFHSLQRDTKCTHKNIYLWMGEGV